MLLRPALAHGNSSGKSLLPLPSLPVTLLGLPPCLTDAGLERLLEVVWRDAGLVSMCPEVQDQQAVVLPRLQAHLSACIVTPGALSVYKPSPRHHGGAHGSDGMNTHNGGCEAHATVEPVGMSSQSLLLLTTSSRCGRRVCGHMSLPSLLLTSNHCSSRCSTRSSTRGTPFVSDHQHTHRPADMQPVVSPSTSQPSPVRYTYHRHTIWSCSSLLALDPALPSVSRHYIILCPAMPEL